MNKSAIYCFIFFLLSQIRIFSEDFNLQDFVDEWTSSNYSNDAYFSDAVITNNAIFEYDGKSFHYMMNITSKTKEYYHIENEYEKEYFEEFYDYPIPKCFFLENQQIKNVPSYLLKEIINEYYPEVEDGSATYKDIANQIVEYCKDYKDPFLIISTLNYNYYIYYEPIDEFIRIFAP